MDIRIKIKINGSSQWYRVLNKVQSMGVCSRDGMVDFIPSKPDMVLRFTSHCIPYLLNSRADYRPKRKYDRVITGDQFLSEVSSLTELIGNISATEDSTACANPGYSKADLSRAYEDGEFAGFNNGFEAGKRSSLLSPELQVTDVDLVVMNPVLWATVGIPWLQDELPDLVEHDGKYFILDVANNTSVEITAVSVNDLAKEDLLNNERSPWTEFVKTFQLVLSVTQAKKVG